MKRVKKPAWVCKKNLAATRAEILEKGEITNTIIGPDFVAIELQYQGRTAAAASVLHWRDDGQFSIERGLQIAKGRASKRLAIELFGDIPF